MELTTEVLNPDLLDDRIREVIAEVVPELAPKKKHKMLGLWTAMKKVALEWNENFIESRRSYSDSKTSTFNKARNFSIGLGTLTAWAISFIAHKQINIFIKPAALNQFSSPIIISIIGAVIGLVFWAVFGFIFEDISSENSKIKKTNFDIFNLGFMFLFPILFVLGLFTGHKLQYILPTLPLLLWVSQAFRSIYVDYKKACDEEKKVVILPSTQEVERRVVNYMKKVTCEAKRQVVGIHSPVGKRLEELRESMNEAETLRRYFSNRWDQNSSDQSQSQKFKNLFEEAEAALNLLKNDLESLLKEQEVVLEFFREVEVTIPEQEIRISDMEFEQRLRELQGKSKNSREVSQEILLSSLRPIFEKFLPLEEARKNLQFQALAKLEGPGSIAKLLAGAEKIAEESQRVENVVLDFKARLEKAS